MIDADDKTRSVSFKWNKQIDVKLDLNRFCSVTHFYIYLIPTPE